MDNLTDLTARPRPLTVRGRTYWIHPFTIDDFSQLQGWVDQQFPDPFEVVRAELDRRQYNVPQQQFLLERALERATRGRRLVGSPEADAVVNSLPGMQQVLCIAIRKGDPTFTETDAKELYLSLSLADLAAVYQATTLDMVISDPKGSSGTGPQNGNGTSHRTPAQASTGGGSSTTAPSSSSGRRKRSRP